MGEREIGGEEDVWGRGWEVGEGRFERGEKVRWVLWRGEEMGWWRRT